MKRSKLLTGLILAGFVPAGQAAVYEFAPYDVGLVYSDKDKVNIGFAQYNYDYEGDYPASLGGGKTGKSFASTNMFQFGTHVSLTDDLSVSLQMYKPYDLSVTHKTGAYAGAKANLNSQTTAATFKYQLSPNYSVLLGASLNEFSGSVTVTKNLSGVQDLSAELRRDMAPGLLAGASFHLPDMALRASLIYQGEIEHNTDIVESGELIRLKSGGKTNTALGKTEVTMPQAIIFDFQTGITESTLLTFSSQWRQWSKHKIETPVAGKIASFEKDATTHKLGIAQQLTQNWSIFGQYIHEEKIGGDISPLAPNDGYRGLMLANAYQLNDLNFILAFEYGKSDKVTDIAGTRFDDNKVTGVAFQIEKFF